MPVTVAVNCCWVKSETLTTPGCTVTCTVEAVARMVTVAVEDFVESACDVAFTVAVAGLGTVAGAVYKPEAEMVPPPATDQVTAELVVPVTVAENCLLVPTTTLAVNGMTTTETRVGFVLLLPPPLAQEAIKRETGIRRAVRNFCNIESLEEGDLSQFAWSRPGWP